MVYQLPSLPTAQEVRSSNPTRGLISSKNIKCNLKMKNEKNTDLNGQKKKAIHYELPRLKNKALWQNSEILM